MTELIVFSPQDNNRLQYVLDYVLVQRCGISYTLIADKSELAVGPTINYSTEQLPNSIKVEYSLYLQQLINVPDFELELIFESSGTNFDFFAAIFFLLARVEEYDSRDLDEHGRYKAENSLLYKKQLLDTPVIDVWIFAFRKELTERFNLALKAEKYELTSTIDVDHIYAYKHKPTAISLGSLIRDLLTLKFDRVKGRYLENDPYDRLEDMLEWHKAAGLAPIIFVLTAQRSNFDKSLSPTSLPFITKISALAQETDIGIHPSYASNISPHIVKKEKNDLTAIIGRPISKSR